MTNDERERYESEVDTELAKVWFRIGREDDREALRELLHAIVRTRSGPLVWLTLGDVLAEEMVKSLPTDGPGH